MPATIEYDSTGNVMAAVYKPSANEAEQTYYYAHNCRGDVVALYNSTGSLFARYDYDAWGKLLSIKDASGNDITDYTSFAIINPIRYRGYFYDTESGLYYLQSRYYDPTTGRFVNADDVGYLGASDNIKNYNLFAYCDNNPVILFDPDGTIAITTFIIIGAAIGLTAGIISGTYYASYHKKLSPSDGWKYLKYVVGFGLGGAVAGALVGWGVGAAASAIGVSMTAGSCGTLGPAVYSCWQKAEQAVRNANNAVKYTFTIPGMSNRIVDGYNKSKGIIYEVKYGYASLSEFIKTEIARDVWLKANSNQVRAVEWHFFTSQATNKGGPSEPLLKALFKAGIKVVFH